jgi:hypothetical protein
VNIGHKTGVVKNRARIFCRPDSGGDFTAVTTVRSVAASLLKGARDSLESFMAILPPKLQQPVTPCGGSPENSASCPLMPAIRLAGERFRYCGSGAGSPSKGAHFFSAARFGCGPDHTADLTPDPVISSGRESIRTCVVRCLAGMEMMHSRHKKWPLSLRKAHKKTRRSFAGSATG